MSLWASSKLIVAFFDLALLANFCVHNHIFIFFPLAAFEVMKSFFRFQPILFSADLPPTLPTEK